MTQFHFIPSDGRLHDVPLCGCWSVVVMRFVGETETVAVPRNWGFLMENCSSNVITEAACMLWKTSCVTILESTQISHFVFRLTLQSFMKRYIVRSQQQFFCIKKFPRILIKLFKFGTPENKRCFLSIRRIFVRRTSIFCPRWYNFTRKKGVKKCVTLFKIVDYFEALQ